MLYDSAEIVRGQMKEGKTLELMYLSLEKHKSS
jgi:hypothetical protein